MTLSVGRVSMRMGSTPYRDRQWCYAIRFNARISTILFSKSSRAGRAVELPKHRFLSLHLPFLSELDVQTHLDIVDYDQDECKLDLLVLPPSCV